MGEITLKVRGGRGFEALARRFERAAGEVQPRAIEALVANAPDAVAAVRAAWLGIDVQSSRGGGSSSGLRARAAAATRAEATGNGVRVITDGSAVDPRYPGLVKALDGLGSWRHPTYGHEPWQQQVGQEVFYSTLSRTDGPFRAAEERVVEDVAREIRG